MGGAARGQGHIALVYSTNHHDVAALKRLKEEGLNIHEAAEVLLAEKRKGMH
jgi:hypothetical protein